MNGLEVSEYIYLYSYVCVYIEMLPFQGGRELYVIVQYETLPSCPLFLMCVYFNGVYSKLNKFHLFLTFHLEKTSFPNLCALAYNNSSPNSSYTRIGEMRIEKIV